ncbi:MAG: type I DNA topoisomerase [Planctomycetota bacterium]
MAKSGSGVKSATSTASRASGKPRKKTGGRKSARRSKAEATSGKKLVIVESPAKARTINRYLGRDYVVKASMGHVRDLPGKNLGVDLEDGFSPTYEVVQGREKVLAELKKAAKTAPEVYLATDLDREGEAIAWHLAQELKLSARQLRRVVFNEITKTAVQAAFAEPGKIDDNKVNAQQARRILDRIVGYQVSPLLWKKVAAGLSAGRVQTVAVRLIVEREREIEEFMPTEFWKLSGVFTANASAAALEGQWLKFLAKKNGEGKGPTEADRFAWLAKHKAFRAELIEWDGERFECADADTAQKIAQALGLAITDRQEETVPDAKGPAANRVTLSGRFHDDGKKGRRPGYRTLQQAASVRLRYSASRTMRIAQTLYEGVEVPGEGSVGLITYMRTDSVNLSKQAVTAAREFIGEQLGERYLPDKPVVYRSGARAQQAHEAVRPTDVTRTPESLAGALKPDQMKLYDLIWRRFVACQMAPAQWDSTDVSIAADTSMGKAVFRAVGRRLAFDGHLKISGMPRHEEQALPPLDEGQDVTPATLAPTQHFTQPPPRYTEASLVKALEAEGIGRPSTYASIIQTIQAREYVEQQDRRFYATALGMKVNDKLLAHFSDIFDLRFTARMEERLDEIEEARLDWVKVLEDFYGPFKSDLEKATEEMVHAKAEVEPSDYTCPDCGKEMVYRWSRYGKYLACTGYPDCKKTFPVDNNGDKVELAKTDVACPICGEPLVRRRGRYGPFLSCVRSPDCKGILGLDKKGGVKLPSPPPLEVELTCPKCEKPLYLRRGARGPWLSCSGFPKCRGRLGWKTLIPEQHKALGRKLRNHEKANPQPVIKTVDGAPVEAGYQPRELAPAKSAS